MFNEEKFNEYRAYSKMISSPVCFELDNEKYTVIGEYIVPYNIAVPIILWTFLGVYVYESTLWNDSHKNRVKELNPSLATLTETTIINELTNTVRTVLKFDNDFNKFVVPEDMFKMM